MILDRGPRALIFGGFFCLAAALSGAANAVEVYPGCAEPGPIGKVWYVDPVNGKTPADGGNGSQTAPWNSLNGVLSGNWAKAGFSVPGYTRPLLSTIPYLHVVTGVGRVNAADQIGAPPVQPGDEILLMSGQYGDIAIGAYALRTTNSAFVTIAAAPGQTPVFSSLTAYASSYFMFSGIKVQSLGTARALVNISDGGPAGPTSNIILHNLNVSSADTFGLRDLDAGPMGRQHSGGDQCSGLRKRRQHNLRISRRLAHYR